MKCTLIRIEIGTFKFKSKIKKLQSVDFFFLLNNNISFGKWNFTNIFNEERKKKKNEVKFFSSFKKNTNKVKPFFLIYKIKLKNQNA